MQAVIRHHMLPEEQQAKEQRAVALLIAAAPGDADRPASWAGHARLAPHALATAPLREHSPAGRQLVLDTARYLETHGDIHASQAVCQQLLDRWRATLGPDHPDTLTAASLLTLALNQLGDTAAARALGEDTLQRSRRVLGPHHLITLLAAQVVGDSLR